MLNIKGIRNRKKMTIAQLAAASGISSRMISAYEAQDNDISLKRLQSIASALGVSVSELIQEDNNHSKTVTGCTNPACLARINRLERLIDDLVDDKVRLKRELEAKNTNL